MEPTPQSSSRNVIIVVIVIVVLLIVGALIWTNSGSTSENAMPAATTAGTANPAAVAPSTAATAPSAASAGTDASLDTSGEISAGVARTVSMTYDGTGFAPASVTITKGEKVTFVNASDSKMWVASDPHPTHTDYPGFDEKTSVGKGGTYSFTFTKVGSWGFHNHMNPSAHGTVVVQ